MYGGTGFPVEVGDYSAVRDRNLHIEKWHRTVALNYKARDKMIWGHVRNLTIFVFRLVQDTLVVLNMTFKIFLCDRMY